MAADCRHCLLLPLKDWAPQHRQPCQGAACGCAQVLSASDLANALDQRAVGDRVELSVQRTSEQARAHDGRRLEGGEGWAAADVRFIAPTRYPVLTTACSVA